MQTASSAKRTWRESWSDSEWTASVAMFNSLHERMTRRAISPRLAMRIFWNIASYAGSIRNNGWPYLDGLGVFHQDGHHAPVQFGLDGIHQLHGFDDAQLLAGADPVLLLNEGSASGSGDR